MVQLFHHTNSGEFFLWSEESGTTAQWWPPPPQGAETAPSGAMKAHCPLEAYPRAMETCSTLLDVYYKVNEVNLKFTRFTQVL
jgi:hypothetical protein